MAKNYCFLRLRVEGGRKGGRGNGGPQGRWLGGWGGGGGGKEEVQISFHRFNLESMLIQP